MASGEQREGTPAVSINGHNGVDDRESDEG